MEWDDLKHFLAVARLGSLAEAARSLKTSPATIGRRITALETRLSARLFDRNQTGYTLTKSGEALRTRAEEVETSILKVEREVLGHDLRAAGPVRLATANEIAATVIAPHLGDFRRRYPDILLEIVGDLDIANLARREADVALRTVRPPDGDLVIRHAGWWKCGLYAAQSYIQSHALRPGIKDFSSLDIITWTEEHAHRRAHQWFVAHAPGSNVALKANSRRIHFGACQAGIGLAILPCLLADQDPNLIQLLPPKQVFVVDLYMVVHRDLTRTARVRAVIDFLVKRISKCTR